MEVELQFTENMIRGKRTKRPRPCSPLFDSNGEHCLEATSEEDEDMANCLILLAQSVCVNSPIIKEEKTDQIRYKTEKINSRKLTDITSGKSGYYVYECKTCNRTFPSFQALGGHRASHKKPKLNIEEKEAESMVVSLETNDQNPKNRVNDNYEKHPSE
ncbi:zinc finger protein ZAT5-like protein [Tanacetum coccineum]